MYLFNQNVLLLSETSSNGELLTETKRQKTEKMLHVAVYFTVSEIKEIRRKAGKDVLKISPYLRQKCVQFLGLNGKT